MTSQAGIAATSTATRTPRGSTAPRSTPFQRAGLAYHFLNKFSRKYGKRFSGIAPDALKKLIDYSWPGNVRELEHVIERAMIMEGGGELSAVYVPKNSGAAASADFYPGLARLEDMERSLIGRTLESLQGQRAKAAGLLGISTTSLWRKIKKFGLE